MLWEALTARKALKQEHAWGILGAAKASVKSHREGEVMRR